MKKKEVIVLAISYKGSKDCKSLNDFDEEQEEEEDAT